MKRRNKVIAIIILIITILSLTTISYGFGVGDLKGTQTQTTKLTKAGNMVMQVILTIGITVSVIVLIVLGIKYMMGSTEEKAEYKKSLMPYVIGAGLVFAASSIAQIIYNLAIQL